MSATARTGSFGGIAGMLRSASWISTIRDGAAERARDKGRYSCRKAAATCCNESSSGWYTLDPDAKPRVAPHVWSRR